MRERADESEPGSVGAPMPGLVVDVKVEIGDDVDVGDPLAVLSAMKMETVIASPVKGSVARFAAKKGDSLQAGDLVVELD